MILICWGTRPEYIKLRPIIDEFIMNGHRPKLLYVHQHEDIKKFDYYDLIEICIPRERNRLDSIVCGIMTTDLWEKNQDVTHVMVQGDTTTAMAVALSAFHNGKRVIHVEAGLRTFDNYNPWPEEMNRKVISSIADIHFTPTLSNSFNLYSEAVCGEIHCVGNTAIDNLIGYEKYCEYLDNVLVTMHRRENLPIMHEWFKAINDLAKNNPSFIFTLPMHHNPWVRKHLNLLKNVNVIEAVSHNEMLHMLTKVKAVITDSGGLQEECSYFNKLCFVCRKVTERKEVDGTSTILVRNPGDLGGLFNEHIDNYDINFDCPYGYGGSAKKIYNILKDEVILDGD